jgi:hypothetical protein
VDLASAALSVWRIHPYLEAEDIAAALACGAWRAEEWEPPCAKSNCYPRGGYDVPKVVLPAGTLLLLVGVGAEGLIDELKRAGGASSEP